ncbi:TIGR01777 family oxidoreductase [Halobacillus faecis]|uniref:Epimerase n=1 Tax=Halobacillus faecis TaxID=360184 RepID=A0A511WWB2_9BACI|nr:TIGR01777 family oxidoreductase [Halobacillus faecis]GEN55399.1 epimerase [Halobacillus faecis]
MKIAITGGTGFVGTQLKEKLVQEGHDVYILTRSPKKYKDTEQVTYVGWLKEEFHPENELPVLDAIVNLAGESLNSGRWTEERKQSILESRIKSTEGVLDLIDALPEKPNVLVNASAVGFYGQSKTKTFTEETTEPGNDFLANVVEEWEARASQAAEKGIRTVYVRFGIILGEEGALPKMTLPYKMMIGGNLGSGEQWMSWVHIDDVVGLVHFAIENQEIHGPLNGTAPNPKRNKDFGHTLGEVLNRPHWIPAPSFALKAALGDMSTLLLDGQCVIPKKAMASGYTFHYPELQPALSSILNK